jgi:hypothetical protein
MFPPPVNSTILFYFLPSPYPLVLLGNSFGKHLFKTQQQKISEQPKYVFQKNYLAALKQITTWYRPQPTAGLQMSESCIFRNMQNWSLIPAPGHTQIAKRWLGRRMGIIGSQPVP